jgi:hypothetical protein
VDDVINVSGHRIGTAEVEGALCHNAKCAEAAVVPVEHPIKGQAIYAFVTLMVVRALLPLLLRKDAPPGCQHPDVAFCPLTAGHQFLAHQYGVPPLTRLRVAEATCLA